MSEQDKTITVPDIGTDDAVEVIEINVGIGDTIEEEDTLITLESEKASMEIPSPASGKVSKILLSVGDKVTTGTQILVLQEEQLSTSKELSASEKSENDQASVSSVAGNDKVNSENVVNITKATTRTEEIHSLATATKMLEVLIPDIGTDDKVDVIDVPVNEGDSVEAEDSLVTLESEKASMDIPAPESGIVRGVKLKVGDKVGEGDLVLYLEVQSAGSSPDPVAPASANLNKSQQEVSQAESASNRITDSAVTKDTKPTSMTPQMQSNLVAGNKLVYASPSIRRFANDLGVDLSKIIGTGRKNRILKSDVEHFVKTQLKKLDEVSSSGSSGLGLDIIPLPDIDYSKFGTVQEKPLSRIKKLSAANLHRNWVVVPHVTQFDEADITEMEAFRQKYKKQAQDKGYKLTPLVFLMRAAAQALKLMPQFNVSLSNDGQTLFQKEYFHIGIAVDTPNGLVVPVVRDVDQKGLFQLAQELGEISIKARDGKLQAKDMQGGCFTISSLGGIGGTAFTPIVNVPDVAILGVSKSQMKPVYQDGEFVPRLMLPLSLSYDHRAIDGADAARFITLYSQLLGDISQLLL